jgi:hypothetical protein
MAIASRAEHERDRGAEPAREVFFGLSGNVVESIIEQEDILDEGDAEDAEREAAMLAAAAD